MVQRTTLPFLLCAAAVARVAADNLSCTGTGMDWYINMVGETPCQTYQSLRQICNSQYTVGVQNINTPPDTCTDQVSGCCCNTIAFSLSMLCLNCQQNIGTGIGIDAGTGAYTDYLNGCSNPQSFKLPTDIQTAVCNEKLKIDDDIYTNGWPDGSCVFTSETIQKDNIVANNNSFTHCASTTLNTSSAPGSSSSYVLCPFFPLVLYTLPLLTFLRFPQYLLTPYPPQSWFNRLIISNFRRRYRPCYHD
ncbi:hypothetical protein B0H12DRAFT_1030325 [Mycena haematopus]|nr:hypothetical protein B0H12DRAFT_1030325 [Mycena haematopus]